MYYDESPETARRAIEEAERLLPGTPSAPDENDPRWHAIIQIGYFIESDAKEAWEFIARWGGHEQEDLRNAIACCLLEHELEFHFEQYFPKVEELAARDVRFADCFTRCWKFGKSELPGNAERFDALQGACRQRISNT
ncbi:MAG TPA: hypothetical protein VHD36_00420 [Pirellulales bacterium]|nr:hypothetical protein [Pirellulales bacterium]